MNKIYSQKNRCACIVFLFLTCYFFNLKSQNIIVCDTSGITQYKDSLIIFKCQHYYNFFKKSVDSVVAINAQIKVNSPITICATVKNKMIEGPFYYAVDDTVLFMKGFMKNNKADSTIESYLIYMNNYKKVSSKSNFQNGNKEGEEIEYNSEGKIHIIRNFKHGLLDGVYKQYDEYGNVLSEGIYKKGKKNNMWIETNPAKRIATYQNFKNDKLVDSKVTSFYANGKVFFEGDYNRKGQKNGTFRIYNDKGVLTRVEKYKNGKGRGYVLEYVDGVVIRKIKYGKSE